MKPRPCDHQNQREKKVTGGGGYIVQREGMYSDLQGFGSMLNIRKMEYWGCGHMVECFPNKNRAPSSISSATEKKARKASADRCSGTQKVGEQGGKIYCDFLFKYPK